MSLTTANWHWKNKNVTRWAKEWFERELTSIVIKGDSDSESVSILEVQEVEGDVELGQRKSKLITIFDCKIDMKWIGTASDGTEVNGTVTVPEVSHEVTVDGLSDYLYEWTLSTTSSPPVDAVFTLAKSKLPTALEVKFADFATAIIDTHGKDLTVSTEPSRSGTPVSTSAAASASTATSVPSTSVPAKPAKKTEQKKSFDTTTVSVQASFMADAAGLFSLLTDEKQIPRWTHSSNDQSTAQVGAGFSLFGGNVKGTYVSLTPPTEIVQTWALQSPTWPDGHFGKLTTTFVQSSDSTEVKFSLADVPKNSGDEIRQNLERYYLYALRSIGLGSIL